MTKMDAVIALSPVVFFCLTEGVSAQMRERSEIEPAYQWNLQNLYPSDEAWQQAKNELAGRLDEIGRYQGKLSEAGPLLACLELGSEFSKTFGRLYSYAAMHFDQNTRQSEYLALRQEVQQLMTEFGSLASFIEPEIARLDAETVATLIEAEPGLEVYRMYLLDVLRRKAHKLSEAEESILARTAPMADGPGSIYTVFSNAEMPYPEITLSDGREVTLNKAGYALHRASTVRADREAVFQAFWDAHAAFKQSFGVKMYSHLQSHVFYTRTRNYESSLARALDSDNVPTEVYSALIANVRDNLDTFYRYLRLRRRMLGVETLKYSDMYAPVVKDLDLRYTFDEAKDLLLDAVKPLGADYAEAVRKALTERWIDVYPTPGKRAGAYSNGGVYDVHPYILLNYNGRFEDISTLAHEMGHAMHSFFANKHQPYPLAGYSIFVAEVASTFNEALLMHKMLDEIEDDDTRLSLLMEYLDAIKGTVFRQTQFAEFELQMHEKAERREPVTGDTITQLYGDILKDYYGHEQGVCHVDDLYAVEWAYVPHFYSSFYVYQYATSFTAATAMAEAVFSGERDAVQRYLDFISAGGSDYPIEVLKQAGVDMTTAEPFTKTMAAMNRTMDEIESILARREGK